MATIIFVGVVIFAFKRPVSEGIALAGFMLLFYVPMGYYTDLFFYRRRQAKLQREKAEGR